ncbi:MAG: electron transfer flavoprotein subunit beta/FixA family protein [Myxococcales bacterium]
MKILVTTKRVEDPESKIRVRPDGSGIVTEGLVYKSNPFDEIAVEEALRLVAKHGGEVVVVSIGPEQAQVEIRHALALGADRGIWLEHDGALDSDLVARLLAAVARRELPDLMLMGKQAIDDDQNQAGQILAELLGWGQITFASKEESLESEAEQNRLPAIEIDGKVVRALREVDGGVERLEVDLPAVVTTDLRLNKRRFASLMGIRKARTKPIEHLTPAALEVDTALKVKVLRLSPPPERKGGEMVPDVATLVRKLREEAKVI